ncbi:MAG: crotonase/enoyl-CoA hydratase family protein [Halioglobus sp.]|nr:crotonase/enoyl-CoA hydratase family protein [Halioglobus sp.]
MDYTLDNNVAIIHFDDGKANVVSPAFSDAMQECLDRAEADGAGAVLLCGREGMFSAGFDLKIFQKSTEEGIGMVLKGIQLAIRLYSFPMPVVAACTGHGIAMGAFLLMSCDTRVGALGEYQMSMPETRINMDIPTPLVALSMSRLTPRYATRAAIQAEVFGPELAVEAGFLDEAVAPDQVVPRAREIAESLAQLPTQHYATNKLAARTAVLATMREELEKALTAAGQS